LRTKRRVGGLAFQSGRPTGGGGGRKHVGSQGECPRIGLYAVTSVEVLFGVPIRSAPPPRRRAPTTTSGAAAAAAAVVFADGQDAASAARPLIRAG